jgi:hypothetical protein
MNARRLVVAVVLAATILAGTIRGGLVRKGIDVVITDSPQCEFAWLDWDYTNITNPLMLTKNTLDKSMIGIMRIPVGDTLPRGKTRISAKMTSQQIGALLRENLQARPEKIGSITSAPSTVAGSRAVRIRYVQAGNPTRRGEEYGFIRSGHFFHLLFLAVEGPALASEQKDFDRVVSTFRVLQ